MTHYGLNDCTNLSNIIDIMNSLTNSAGDISVYQPLGTCFYACLWRNLAHTPSVLEVFLFASHYLAHVFNTCLWRNLARTLSVLGRFLFASHYLAYFFVCMFMTQSGTHASVLGIFLFASHYLANFISCMLMTQSGTHTDSARNIYVYQPLLGTFFFMYAHDAIWLLRPVRTSNPKSDISHKETSDLQLDIESQIWKIADVRFQKKWKRKEGKRLATWDFWVDPCGARLEPGLNPLRLLCARSATVCNSILGPGRAATERLLQQSDLDLKKRVFWGKKTHDWDQCNDLETKYITECENPKIHENAQILWLEFRTSVARGSCGAMQHTHAHTHIHTHTCASAHWHMLHTYTRSAAQNSQPDHARPSWGRQRDWGNWLPRLARDWPCKTKGRRLRRKNEHSHATSDQWRYLGSWPAVTLAGAGWHIVATL